MKAFSIQQLLYKVHLHYLNIAFIVSVLLFIFVQKKSPSPLNCLWSVKNKTERLVNVHPGGLDYLAIAWYKLFNLSYRAKCVCDNRSGQSHSTIKIGFESPFFDLRYFWVYLILFGRMKVNNCQRPKNNTIYTWYNQALCA